MKQISIQNEIRMAKRAIAASRKEEKLGKLKKLRSLSDLMIHQELDRAEKDWDKHGGLTLKEMKKKYRL